MLDKLRVACYRFTLRAEEPLSLPPYKGSTLRGGFGAAFKRICCHQPQVRTCEGCLLRGQCPYAYVFETAPPPDAEVLRANSSVPEPFVIEPPLDERTDYPPGEALSFGLVLVGRAIDLLPYFVLSFREMAQGGIGRGRRRCALEEIQAVDRLGGREEVVYRRPEEIVHNRQLVVDMDQVDRRAKGLAGDSLRVQFLTPTRLRHEGQFVVQPQFHELVRGLLRRLSSLYYFHCGERWEADYRGLIEAASLVQLREAQTTWVDWERYSSRQEARMRLGGFVGEVVYEGDLAPFLPMLVLGELVHAGKACTFGLGQYRLG